MEPEETGQGCALINNDFCEACQSGGRLLLCESCPRGFHVQCIERLVDLESLKTSTQWSCPVCIYGPSVLRGKAREELSEEEMKARMSEALRVSKRSRQMATRQRDCFLLKHVEEVLPFASRPALTRLRQVDAQGQRPFQVGSIVQVHTGQMFYDAIILSQASASGYVVADLVTKTQELKDAKWLFCYDSGLREGESPDFLNFAQPVVSETTKLKEYQQAGVNWLISSFFNRCGGILADDMGLGKTLQTLAFLSYLQATGAAQAPALVVVPLSCAGNWAREAKRFVPHLSIAKVCGTTRERQHSLDDNEIWYGMKDVIITTYETLTSTEDFFRRHHWSTLVLDEAHRIKNQNSKVREVMDTIPCAARFLLTGTPLQNNLGELFALLKFLWPDVMATESKMFENAIQLPELQDKVNELNAKAKVDHVLVQKIRHILGLVMLRRRKEEVIRLPPKIFHNIWLPSTPMQVSWYKKILRLRHLVMNRDMRKLKKLIVRLRSVACHPRCLLASKEDREYLISSGVTSQEELEMFQGSMSEEVIAQSAKLTFLDKLLQQLHAQNMGINDAWRRAFEDRQAKVSEKRRKNAAQWLQGTSGSLFLDEMQPLKEKDDDRELAPLPHKVLIFCQYISTLDFLESYCAYRNWRSLRMDGATSRVLRELDMRDFNSHDEDLFVYLIGTRAGGLGVNLASANHVVIFEQDWNPHVDLQAIDRAHRIGQSRQVHVHRPVQEWGIEERLVLRAAGKLQMEQCIINAKEEDEDVPLADSEDSLSAEEILNLLAHGASAFKAFEGESLESLSLQDLLERERRSAPTDAPALDTLDAPPPAPPVPPPPEPPADALRSSSGRLVKKTMSFADEFQQRLVPVNRKPKVVLKHFAKCFVCQDGVEVKRGRVVEAAEGRGNPVEVACFNCPQTYHKRCLPPQTRELRKNWICPWHYCSQCNRGSSDVGGMLIHCLECPSALCHDCFPPNFRRVYPEERFWSEMQKRGWNTSPQKMIFFKCNSCRTLEEQQTRLRMRAEDLAVQQDERKRAALEEKRSLEVTKKRQVEEEATRRMKSFLLDIERQQLSQEQLKWSGRVEHAAESLWPKLFRSKWIFRVNLSQQSAEELGRAMVGKKAALPSVERLKLGIESCSNCHFPGHKAKQCPLPMEKVAAKEKEGARGAPRRLCPICDCHKHGRINCPQLTGEQRSEYLERVKDFRRLQEAFAAAAAVAEPERVQDMKDTASADVMVAAHRAVEASVRQRVREILKELGLERFAVAAEAEEKARAFWARAAAAAEKKERQAEAAAKKAAERQAAKEKALAKAAAAKAKAAAKRAGGKPAPQAKRKAEAPGSSRGSTEVVRYISFGPATGWMVKGRAYSSGTQYFVKRPEGQLWETRYQALKSLEESDPIRAAVEKLRNEIAEALAAPQQKASSSDEEPAKPSESPSRKRLRLTGAKAPEPAAPASPRVLRLKVSSSSDDDKEPKEPAARQKEASPAKPKATPSPKPKASPKSAGRKAPKAAPVRKAPKARATPVRKEPKRRASLDVIPTLD